MTTGVLDQPGAFDSHFRDEICRQDKLEGASTVLADAAEALGWDLAAFHVNVAAADLPRTENGNFIAERMGWPLASLEGWRRFRLGSSCPIGSLCEKVWEPFYWSCDDRDSSWFDGEFDDDHSRALRFYGRFMAGGVAVPVHRGSCTGYVSWCSRNREGHKHADGKLGSMFFISHVFICHAEGLLTMQGRKRGADQLTDRELECLTWAARGKSEAAIAEQIHRSRDTVHFHLQNAVRKLDANNRTHAVAIASSRGLVNLR